MPSRDLYLDDGSLWAKSARRQSLSFEEYESLKGKVYAALTKAVGRNFYDQNFGYQSLREQVFTVIRRVVRESSLVITDADRALIVQSIVDDFLGLGPIEVLLRDPDVTEIMVNSPTSVYVEREGVLSKSEIEFNDNEQILQVIERIVSGVGRRVDETSPMVDARLPDGSRVNAIVPPIAVDGPSFTIRKFSGRAADREDLLRLGSISVDAFRFLEYAIRGKRNILISGGTGTGKTTTLNILSALIPPDERIVTIEDSAELKLGQKHVVRLEAKPPNIEGVGEVTIRALVRNSLRMRPNRIVVGEVRDAAALDMLQAMNTGHDGSLSTVHANSNADALSRIETMAAMSEIQLPISIIREQIASAIDLLVHQERLRDGSRKITAISEVTGLSDGQVQIRDIFSFQYLDEDSGSKVGSLQPTGLVPGFLDELSNLGVDVEVSLFEASS